MSGNLVGGVVGAVIGFMVGGPSGAQLGWMAGSIAGGLLAPQAQAGPDLTDLKPQASEYGRPVPIVYSIMSVGGNIIWAADLIKTSDGGGGGKGGGGGSSTGPTYAANFAVLICESDGSMGLGKIWSGPDKRLVYNPVGNLLESGTVTFYNGEETQMPDPLMEAALGIGQVPAYRGFAYIVIEGFDVSKYDGNRIPFLTIEVGHNPTAAPGLGTVWFDRLFYDSGNDWLVSTYHGSFYGVLANHASDKTMYHNRGGDSDYFGYAPFSGFIYDAARNQIVRLLQSANISTGDLYTTLNIDSGLVSDHDLGATTGEQGRGAVEYSSQYVFAFNMPAGGVKFYFVNPVTGAVGSTKVFDAGGSTLLANGLYGPSGDNVWGTCTDGSVRVYDLSDPDGSSSTSIGSVPTGFSPDEAMGAYDSINDRLWLVHYVTGGTLHYGCYSNSATINADSISTIFYSLGYQPWLFTADPGDGSTGVWICGTRWLAVDHYIRFDPTTGEAIALSEVDGAYVGINTINATIYNEANNSITAYRYNGYWSETSANNLYPYNLPYNSGYLGVQDASLEKQTLAEIVTDLSERAGLTIDDIDVSQLTDTVDGYTLANQMAVKDAISTLMPAYYFDAVESEGVIKFVKRGGEISVVIPEDDLGAHPSDEQDYNGDLYQTQRIMDEELPWTFNITYVLEATKYSIASKYSRKLVGYSGNEESVEFPMVFTDTKAAEIAAVNLHDRWIGRLTYSFSVGRTYSYLEPTDIVGIGGYTMRITKMTQRENGIFNVEAVRDDSDTYVPTVIVTETPPFPSTISTPSLTTLELM